jgi:adenylate cyclase class 2
MQTEIEAKFLKQDHQAIREKLRVVGATCIFPERNMRRANYDFEDSRLNDTYNGWVRVRDEGDKVTLSYKQSDDSSVLGTQEVNLVINNFEDAQLFLKAVGITKLKSFQETKRESWELNGVCIELDTWPWINPFVEIEAPSEEQLKDVANKLGLNLDEAVYGSVISAYQAEYEVSNDIVNNLPEYSFGSPVPESFGPRKQ